MSSRWSVRTSGNPYLMFAQNAYDTMVGSTLFGGFGIAQIELEFALHAPVQANASNEEQHQLFSFCDVFIPNKTMLAIGITPSGRVYATSPDGTGPSTAINRIRPDGEYHKVVLSHDGGIGDTRLTVDNDPQIEFVSGAQYAIPATYGRLAIFGGTTGLTKDEVSVRHALAFGTDGINPGTATWDFTETSGGVVKAVKTGGSGWNAHALDLTAQFLGPVSGALPWGNVPTTDPGLDYYWHLRTAWAKKLAKTTSWKRSKVTWPD